MAFAPRLLLGLLTTSLAMAAISAPDALARKTQVLRVRATTTIWWLDADRPPPGSSKGDAIFGSDVLRRDEGRTPAGVRVGRSYWRLVYETPTVADLTETVYLPEGTITCRGKVRAGAKANSLSVVGGSGAFRGATGACRTRPAPAFGPRASLKRYELVVR